jgi:hypothetical protein
MKTVYSFLTQNKSFAVSTRLSKNDRPVPVHSQDKKKASHEDGQSEKEEIYGKNEFFLYNVLSNFGPKTVQKIIRYSVVK